MHKDGLVRPSRPSSGGGRRRASLELGAAIATGALFLLSESSGLPKAAFMAATGLAWGGYTVCRLLRDPRAARDWGFRCDTLPQASRAAALVFAAGALALGIVGATRGTLSLSPHLLACLAVYPAWGIAQQALLLGMGVRNIERWIRSRPALVTIGAG